MGWDAPWHWVIIALLLVALFGYKKLPEMTRSVARSLRIFKTEMKGITEDDVARDAHHAAQAATTPPPAVAPAALPPIGAIPLVVAPIVTPPAPSEPAISPDAAAKSAD